MNRDLVSPLNTDDESFPCPSCGGGGLVSCGGVMIRCFPCGGSGYGPQPPALDREVSHCMERLTKWAHRALPKEEN